jgi:hypothetical protein
VCGGLPRADGLDIRQVRVPIGVIGIIYEARPNVTADAALAATALDPENRTAVASAVEWLKEVLADGPMKTVDLKQEAKDADIAWPTVRRAQKAMGIKPKKHGVGKEGAWYWTLAERDESK